MYYLLEDNRIIDSLSIREDLDLPFEVDFYVQKDAIVLTIDHIHFEHINIIKKVENVYDLIDLEEDLVKFKFNGNEIIRNARDASISYIIGSYPEDVITIYKPDTQGNYIKAWEEKDGTNN